MKVFNDLKTRGVEDVLIAVTDGLKGIPEALGAVFPATTLQTCIVHLIRNSLDYAAWDKRRALAKALKPIYQAINADVAEQELNAFEAGPWGKQYPTVVAAWRRVAPGIGLYRFLFFRRAFAKWFTRPMPSRASMPSYARSSRLEGTSRPMRLRRN
ncbi:prophage PSPPH02, ISPsy18, transposase [Pseudomonas savastanoi pv. glycinea str. B076]|nr:prophage PSPPH02, ISPsy18, transposase [Pseudomonas savastanoi pv. glycinea str. B076]EFW85186.1 prophage PSPPH02, ISPsy18, transposase [Pseudomonas savastanoi pv. glycinea str. race 4]